MLLGQSSEDQKKKRSSSKIEQLLSPNWSEEEERSSSEIEEYLSPKSRKDQKKVQTSSSTQMQIIVQLLEGMQMYTIVKLLGNAVKLLGEYIPSIPRVLAPLLGQIGEAKHSAPYNIFSSN